MIFGRKPEPERRPEDLELARVLVRVILRKTVDPDGACNALEDAIASWRRLDIDAKRELLIESGWLTPGATWPQPREVRA